MSFGEDHELYEEELTSGCRTLSPIPSDITRGSNEKHPPKFQSQNQQNMSSLLNKFINKDKETENLRKENQSLKDKLKEFEYLIIKGSEEVKRKQNEIASLNNIIDSLKQDTPNAATLDSLHRELEEAKKEMYRIKSESAQAQTKLRVEVQKEKELNVVLKRQLAEIQEKFDSISQESKASSEDLQKNFTLTSTKYMQLERDYAEARNLLKEMTHDSEVKDATLEHAHEIISKLKEQLEAHTSGAIQKKVDEYKSKNKSLKKANKSLKEELKEAENKVQQFDQVKKELEEAKEEIQDLMRSRYEERQQRTAQGNEEHMKTVKELKGKVSSLEKENSSFSTILQETQNKLQLKEKEVVRLQECLRNEEERARSNHRFALRGSQTMSQGPQENLPPLHSRQTSPFKALRMSEGYQRNSQSVGPAETNAATSGNTTGRRNSVGMLKSTPIKHYSSKDMTMTNQQNDELSMIASHDLVMQAVEEKKDNKLMGSGNFREMDIGELMNEKEEMREEEPMDFFNIVCLQEELQRSLDREHYFILIIETLQAQSEQFVKEHMDKVSNPPVVSSEMEQLQMKCDEYEQKWTEALEKHNEASEIIMELTKNNRELMNRVDELMREYKQLTIEYNGQSKQFIEEQAYYQKLATIVLQDSKMCTSLLGNQEQRVNPEVLKRLTSDCDNYLAQLKAVEEIIDASFTLESNSSVQTTIREAKSRRHSRDSSMRRSQESTSTKDNGSSTLKMSGQSLASRLGKKLEKYEAKLKQVEDERNELNNRLSMIKTEVKDWRRKADNLEQEYQQALDDKTHVLSRLKDEVKIKEEKLKDAEANMEKIRSLLIERELIINEQNMRINEWSGRDRNLHGALQEKDERIRELVKKKQDLYTRFDEANQKYQALKRELTEMQKETGANKEAISEIQAELMIKDQELKIKEIEVEEKTEQAFALQKIISSQDHELSQIRNDNRELKSQVFELREENIRIEYAYNAAQTEMFPTKTSHRTSQDTKESQRYGSRAERLSVPNIRREEAPQRNSVGSRREKEKVNESGTLLKQLKEDNKILLKENNELFAKLNTLNELVSHNKALEQELVDLRAQATRSSYASIDKSLVLVEAPSSKNHQYSSEKHSRQQERETVKRAQDAENAQVIEKYKAKTKKAFQKRVKELEILLRYIDEKTKGYNFARSSYIICAADERNISPEEARSMSKITFLVETMLEKNSSLKAFVDGTVEKLEKLYMINHNLYVTLGKLFKALLTADHINEGNFAHFELIPELEALSRVNIPNLVSSFNQIETVISDPGSFRLEFFQVFHKIEPRLKHITEFLLKAISQPPVVKRGGGDSFSFNNKAEDFLTAKVVKIREVEGLYSKLKDVIAYENASLTPLPEHIKDYLQTYNNIYDAIMHEVHPIINLTSNLLASGGVPVSQSHNISQEQEKEQDRSHQSLQSHPSHHSRTSSYQSTQPLREITSSNNGGARAGSKGFIRSNSKKDLQLFETSQLNVEKVFKNSAMAIKPQSPEKERFLFKGGNKANMFTPTKPEENIPPAQLVQSEKMMSAEKERKSIQRLSFNENTPEDFSSKILHSARY